MATRRSSVVQGPGAVRALALCSEHSKVPWHQQCRQGPSAVANGGPKFKLKVEAPFLVPNCLLRAPVWGSLEEEGWKPLWGLLRPGQWGSWRHTACASGDKGTRFSGFPVFPHTPRAQRCVSTTTSPGRAGALQDPPQRPLINTGALSTRRRLADGHWPPPCRQDSPRELWQERGLVNSSRAFLLAPSLKSPWLCGLWNVNDSCL